MKERLIKVEQDISEIKSDIAVIKNNIGHIVKSLSGLSCKEHKEKIVCLERKFSNAITVWATISTAILLIGVMVGIFANLRG